MRLGPAISGDLGAKEIVRMLNMQRHPEGGWYVETYRAPPAVDNDQRSIGTAIYYLLEAGDLSHWHAVDAAEIWHWYAGGPLALTLSTDGVGASAHQLGPELRAGQRPQIIVEPNVWQTAESLGAWTLCGCTVSPGFEFSGFKLAPPDWRPSPAGPPADQS